MAGLKLGGLWLGLLVLQVQDAVDPDPAELVTRLGAPRYAEREAAGEALVKIGRAALPALVRARADRDPEVRRRAEALAVRIEAAEVLEATRVRLDIHDRPLAEAAEAIGQKAGMTLSPGATATRAQPQQAWPEPERQVTLEDAEPVPFWEAVDRLCRAGGLQRRYPGAGGDLFDPFEPPFVLTLVPGPARPPAVDAGALRVELLRVRHERLLDYGNDAQGYSPVRPRMERTADPQTGATVGSSYRVELFVSAEPRLRIVGVGEVERAEAVDDRGRSLIGMPTGEEQQRRQALEQMNPHLDPRRNPGLRFGSNWRTSMRSWGVSVPLSYPSPPARRIARLSGVVPLVVLARRPDPLVVDLEGAAGKVFGSGPTRITVHEVTVERGREPTVDFTLETAPEAAGETMTMTVYDQNGGRLTVNRPIDLLELRLEVLDGRGTPLFRQFTRAPAERTHGRMAIVVRRRGNPAEPPEGLRLRYWDTIGAATEVPFSFRDVPTP
jgi:hypothetical protein